MFEFLFKYPPATFQGGALEFDLSWPAYLAFSIVLGALLAWLYPRQSNTLGARQWSALAALRTLLLAAVVLALLDPVLVVALKERQPAQVAVLLDDSQSMRIADLDGESRARVQARLFAPGSGSVTGGLDARFDTRYYRFAGHASALRDSAELTQGGARSDLAAALEQVRLDLQGGGPASVVLISDGGAEPGAALADTLLGLRAAAIQVHTVGVGARRYARDLELAAVRVPARALVDDVLEARVSVRQRGFDGGQVRLTVEDEGRLVQERLVDLAADGSDTETRVELRLTEPGPHRLRFALAAQPDETVAQNNARLATVEVSAEPARVLHFEGEPRFEVKFLRRALDGDENLHLVSLVRTAENKFYRLGVASADQLEDGFPSDAQELFEYRALILGSVAAAQLSAAQQALIGEFVDRRGGGLLLLGGRHGLAEGGYAQSALAGLLPVALPSTGDAFRESVRVRPTASGLEHPVIRSLLGQDATEGLAALPPLTVVNPVRTPKPGATLLLRAEDGAGAPLVVLAYHRYGRGTVAVLPVRDTWRWQMHRDVPLEDQTHETLWRQLLRLLVRPAEGRLRLRAEPPAAVPGAAVSLELTALDQAYRPPPSVTLRLWATSPLGERIALHPTPDPRQEGVHRASFTPATTGTYEFEAELLEAGAPGARAAASLEVTASGAEFHDAELDDALLQRIARGTGGRYFDAAQAAELAEAIADLPGARSIERRLPLHDAPALYLLMLVCACLEWWLRRRWRLA